LQIATRVDEGGIMVLLTLLSLHNAKSTVNTQKENFPLVEQRTIKLFGKRLQHDAGIQIF
jgi:hypothetical protein